MLQQVGQKIVEIRLGIETGVRFGLLENLG